ncbi:hypothetical protein FK220_006450 [Flavobacteriaceae bacterium TP-CH-4]|uniref:Uncharacterized protein n=1 Tax=Pelagihabitans pacificus TaxID=2696054 RepID=A0A967ARD1_9FLAO|nr:hypothetical protein [Pelagihabitans pacificus]NHF58971.1 hypothetical protein [Pelagihabitans pacificus]
MIFSNQQLKNMAYRSVHLGITPKEDYILDEKKILNGYKAKKYTLNEQIGDLGESLAENIRKMEIIRGKLSKEVVARAQNSTETIEQEINTVKETIQTQKAGIKEHIRRCQLNGDTLTYRYNIDEIHGIEDFEPGQELPEPKKKQGPKRVPFWALYLVEVLFIFGEGILFYNILMETHDLPVIILRSIFFIPIVFAASFLTSRKISLRWVWLPIMLITGVYAILGFTVMEWFLESQALDETLTFTAFFIKNGFLILGALMMVTLALFLTNAVKSIYNYQDRRKKKKKEPEPIPEPVEKTPQQADLDLKLLELKGSYKRLQKLEEKLTSSQAAGTDEFKRILGDVSVLERKTEELSAQIGAFEKELDTLEIHSMEELSKYREHFENYSNGDMDIQWKGYDFSRI